jgi:hypothetical protein
VFQHSAGWQLRLAIAWSSVIGRKRDHGPYLRIILGALEYGNHAPRMPEFDIVSAEQLLSALLGGVLVFANQIDGAEDVAVHSNKIRTKMLHGDAGTRRDT